MTLVFERFTEQMSGHSILITAFSRDFPVSERQKMTDSEECIHQTQTRTIITDHSTHAALLPE
jgi:hypothetical protein